MNITNTVIPDVKIVDPDVFENDQGFYVQSFDLETFRQALDRPVEFADEAAIHTERHQLIGLHYRLPPHESAQLIHVVNGQTFQVAVDLRKSSPTFGKWVGTVVSDENGYRFWVPEGFAWGALTLSDFADIVCQLTQGPAPDSERRIRWDDPAIAIDWHGVIAPRVSEADLKGKLLYQADVFA